MHFSDDACSGWSVFVGIDVNNGVCVNVGTSMRVWGDTGVCMRSYTRQKLFPVASSGVRVTMLAFVQTKQKIK